jgi:hypothetical protein
VQQIIAARQRWKWGPRKLRIKLAETNPEIVWPVESTIGEVLTNQTWCATTKGGFARWTERAAIR